MFLLDTNVLSDATKLVPHPAVTRWLEAQPLSTLFVSVMSLAEASYGIERRPDGRKADGLRQWLGAVIVDFDGRLLPVDAEVAMAQARIRRAAENARRTMSAIDAFIAATAEVHGLTLVTRNVRDFETWGGTVFNPWDKAP
ncbi:type II toxin-antitoxin system VapC family toxin [Caulobacter rhizosphaerae]|jgi:predicted nucleic acid-binding protein|uniref:type II toxin-antitoxin system VapC family toxin n=1 Tax=Caulobacter rhizosphaerae TaxID=2010972 RepID=UPI0013D1D3D6|nr:type II toxin-antitoxin system VapC family toxin [Caulobacter rhizosphaerae]GGL44464.1 ribonuclease VapC [Caulobacter rhizosphaerae]